MTSLGLYIHIPFCRHICPYCSFYKVKLDSSIEDRFVNALKAEIVFYKERIQNPIHSIFFGGGTPTLLSPVQWKGILTTLRTSFQLTDNCEITTEANPETLTSDYLDALDHYGINRISVGIQSLNNVELQYLGRTHQSTDLERCIQIISESPIKNVNYDLIFGTEKTTVETIVSSLEFLCETHPTHISTYALSIEPNTLFEKKKIPLLSSENELRQYKTIIHHLEKEGYHHYEISAFSKPGYESKHNLTYWSYSEFIGLGPSANSFHQNRRYTREESLEAYLKDPSPEQLINATPPTSIEVQAQEYIMSNLRLNKGLSLEHFHSRFGFRLEEIFKPSIEKLISENLLLLTHKQLKPTKKGLYLLNEILLEFLP